MYFSPFVADRHLPATHRYTVFVHTLDKYVDRHQMATSNQRMRPVWSLLTALALPCEEVF